GALGLGYLFAEIATIQQLTLLLGHPVYAVAFVLAVLLVASGVGSAWSDRLAPAAARPAAAGLGAGLVLLAALLLPAVQAAQPWPLAARAGLALLVLGPFGLVMGTPFPLGLRALAGGRVAWAWAVNGFASVIAAPLGALIALEYGSRTLFLAAALAYGVAGMVGGRNCGRA
ncbi:MAG TPA: hypothetical protein VFH97_08805, partial [Gemmatimonadales bacterium]|nr:hypothetical protein [Gemmatimonadales bacterium]